MRQFLRSLRFYYEQAIISLLKDQPRWSYWLPVALACGIGIYFTLPVEPPAWLAAGLMLLSAAAVGHASGLTRMAAIVLVALTMGILAGAVRTALVATPMLNDAVTAISIKGHVDSVEGRESGERYRLSDISFERNLRQPTPNAIWLNVRDEWRGRVKPGDTIEVLARLLPATEPISPEGYDFRRQAFFEGTGAYGIALRPALIIKSNPESVSRAERWREYVNDRVSNVLTGSEAAIAIALLTGERGAIDDKTNKDMRLAGTSHLLSISGMHIGMVAGLIFISLRALLALSPALALRYPIKQFAAGAALLGIAFYTWFVGAPVPAQRAAIMSALVLVAVLLNRQALTLRGVALAAGGILLVLPESLFNPGFQMSFAAIVMLVAAHESWQLRRRNDAGARQNLWRQAAGYIGGIAITSLIAGLATMPYGVWHFHRLQLLGLLGNMIAVPLTGFIVMPAALLALLLMPFGLDRWALLAMGWGLEGVTDSAAWVASLPGADVVANRFSTLIVVLITFGGLWLAIWRTQLRYAGLCAIAAGLLLSMYAPQPIALVSPEGKIAIRGADGRLHYDRVPRGGLLVENWSLAYDNGQPPLSWREGLSGIECDKLGCVQQAWRLAIPAQKLALADDCSKAGVVVAPDFNVRECASAVVIDRRLLKKHGAHMIMADGRIVRSRAGSSRPWQPYYQADKEDLPQQPNR